MPSGLRRFLRLVTRAFGDLLSFAGPVAPYPVPSRTVYPHRVAPECACEPGSVCRRQPCCYYGETVPENAQKPLGGTKDAAT